MIRTLRHHWLAFTLALLIGLLTVFPSLWAKFRYGITFSDPVNIRIDDEFFYYARIRDVIDGHPALGNAYLWEHKSKPPSPVFLGEWLLAQPLKIFGMNVVTGGVLYDFLLPPIAFFLAYTCFWFITRKRWLSLLSSSIIFFGLEYGTFARAVSPQLNFLFWFAEFIFIFLLFRGFEHRRGRLIFTALAAFNFGLLFYLYTYYWTFYIVLFSLLAIFLFLSGFKQQAKSIAAVLGGGLIVAIPYFWLMQRAFLLPEYDETLRRIGMINTHFPSGLYIVAAAIPISVIGIFLLLRILPWNIVSIFLASGLIAIVAVVNQHVITGKNLEFSSHYNTQAIFWLAFVVAYFLGIVWDKPIVERCKKSFAVIGFSLLAVVLILPNIISAKDWFNPVSYDKVTYHRWQLALKWVNENTKPDEVIYAPSDLSSIIPIYTHANVYFAVPVRLSFLTDAEILDRFIINNYYKDFSDDFVRERERQIFGVYYIDRAAHTAQENKIRRIFGFAPKMADALPEEAVRSVKNRANELKKRNFESELKKYRVDYVVWSNADPDFNKYNNLAFLKKVYNQDGLSVFRVE